MDEQRWLECTEPEEMLAFLHPRASERKRRLFATACCRRVLGLLNNELSRQTVEIAERYADGEATALQLDEAEDEVHWLYTLARDADLEGAMQVAAAIYATVCRRVDWDIAGHAARSAAAGVKRLAAHQGEPRAQVDLIRCIFGNPFRPVPVEPSWLAWGDDLVRRLAEAAYRERQLPVGTLDPGRLAVLADALEEAGCSDPALLEHLRGPAAHVRGCHVVDALLAKEGT